MPYQKKKWTFKKSNEVEINFNGKYGAPGERRAKRVKATPEQIRKQNQWNREKRVRRLIKANFEAGDYWITLTYRAGERKPPEDAKYDLRGFFKKLRTVYRKNGQELKFIYRTEIGKRGAIHHHMVINRLRGEPATDVIVERAWKHGHVSFSLLHEEGDFKALAAYITKRDLEETDEVKETVNYSTSRNLIRPKPETKFYSRMTLKKSIEEGIRPTKGYLVDKDSIVCGVNPVTGKSYLHYTEVKIRGNTGNRAAKKKKMRGEK